MSVPRLRRWMVAVPAIAALALMPASATRVVAQAAAPLLIATGLDNPRGLAFGPGGYLYVAEAGRGGTDATLCLPNPEGGDPNCYGATGAITQVSGIGLQQRVITGLPSLAGPTGAGATGPHDIQFGFDSAWVTVGLGGDPAARAPFEAAGIHLGSLVQITYTGQWNAVVDISAHEAAANPDGGAVDSNPYGLAILADRGVVTDAGGNSLLQIAPTGAVSTLAVFPDRIVAGPGGDMPMQAVPTAVVEGPDGSLYVGQLTGFPFPPGGASIWRVPAEGGDPVEVSTGYTNIIDLAIGADGTAYVLERDADGMLAPGTAGRLSRLGLFGERLELAPGLLEDPGGMTIGPDNAIYVTTHSTSAGGGQVVRIAQ